MFQNNQIFKLKDKETLWFEKTFCYYRSKINLFVVKKYVDVNSTRY